MTNFQAMSKTELAQSLPFMNELELRDVLPLGQDLHNYVRKGFRYSQGKFLTAVITNDFITAAESADHINLEFLSGYAIYMAKYVPLGARGELNYTKWKGLDYYE